ncbi:dynamin family protein [Sporichthya sp.]|uniref:dynamin family protein n=1 Tax=Sporichthya sp. TaxID=65475 RepID=UPI0025ED1088|nr:dynamin family protein [Sporichthya sp.]
MILRRSKKNKKDGKGSDEYSEEYSEENENSAAETPPPAAVREVPVPAARSPHGTPVSTDICGQVRLVLQQAAEVYADHAEAAERIEAHLDRLDSPVRIAIAGKVKAGKSTLLNALVGEVIAPTDAGECTRVVTWYRNAPAPRIVMRRRDGESNDLPIIRQNGRLELGLGGVAPEEVDRLTVDWPSGDLATMTLIDTPGIASASVEVSTRTEDFLTPDEEQGAADAIVYLMRHVHADDMGFLEAFHAHAAIGSSPVNTVAVLSRADEIGAGRVDALQSARAIASRLRADEKIRSLCQTVVPVAGLLAETGRTMRQAEFNALAAIAAADRDYVDAMLLSADRFGRELPEGAPELPSAAIRSALMTRFGLFGVRIALPLIRQGITDSTALAGELVRRSGLEELREALTALFTERGDLLKARSALMALDSILRSTPLAETDLLLAQVEKIFSGAHEFVELALLGSLRTGAVALPSEQRAEAERLLGGTGQAQFVRLGLAPTASLQEIREAATDAMSRWRRRAENPASARPVADAARVIVRTCEGILSSL